MKTSQFISKNKFPHFRYKKNQIKLKLTFLSTNKSKTFLEYQRICLKNLKINQEGVISLIILVKSNNLLE